MSPLPNELKFKVSILTSICKRGAKFKKKVNTDRKWYLTDCLSLNAFKITSFFEGPFSIFYKATKTKKQFKKSDSNE